MGIELGTVDANEFCLAAHRNPAGAAHAGAVHHDGVQAGDGRDIVLFGQQGDEFHHDGRPDGYRQVNGLALQHLLDPDRDHAFFSIRAVIGHDDRLVGERGHLLFQDQEFAVARAQNGDQPVAGLLESPGNGIERGDAHAAAAGQDRPELFDLGRPAQGAGHVQTANRRGSSLVILQEEVPTFWMIRVMVPFSRSASAMVSGIRSPFSSMRTMTNWPGLCLRATCGASTTSFTTFSDSSSFSTILFMVPPSRTTKSNKVPVKLQSASCKADILFATWSLHIKTMILI